MGRPPKDRYTAEDRAYIKSECLKASGTLSTCYKEIFTEAQRGDYKNLRQPVDVETVKSAFGKYLSGRRPLPDVYWLVLEELYGIKRSDLPSQQQVAVSPNSKRKLSDSSNSISSPKASQPSEHDQTAKEDRLVNILPRDNQSLPNWFRRLSLLGIRRVVTAAESTDTEENRKLLADLFESECINVIAEKVVNESVGELDYFWSGDDENTTIAKILEAVFNLIICGHPLMKCFIANMKNWFDSQPSDRIFEYIHTLTFMCRELKNLQGFNDEFDRIIAKGFAKIKPDEAERIFEFGLQIRGLLYNFKVLHMFFASQAVVALFVRDDCFLAKEAIKNEQLFLFQDLWDPVKTYYNINVDFKMELKPEDPLYDEWVCLHKFRRFLDDHKLVKDKTRK